MCYPLINISSVTCVKLLIFFRNFLFNNELYVNKIKDGRISFAFEEIIEFPVEIVKLLWMDITHMDLSGNNISNFEFLNGFIHLKSLIVDGNLSIGCKKTRMSFPPLPKLELFYCNNCDISLPSEFIIRISALFPMLKYFSLMEFKTIMVDEDTLHQLRMLAIFLNPLLVHFNDKLVSDDERNQAKDLHALNNFNARREQNVGKVTRDLEDFFEAEKIEKSLILITMKDYLKNISPTTRPHDI